MPSSKLYVYGQNPGMWPFQKVEFGFRGFNMMMEFGIFFYLFIFEIQAKLMVGLKFNTHYKFKERFGQ